MTANKSLGAHLFASVFVAYLIPDTVKPSFSLFLSCHCCLAHSSPSLQVDLKMPVLLNRKSATILET